MDRLGLRLFANQSSSMLLACSPGMVEPTPLANEESSYWGHFLAFLKVFLAGSVCESEHTDLVALTSLSQELHVHSQAAHGAAGKTGKGLLSLRSDCEGGSFHPEPYPHQTSECPLCGLHCGLVNQAEGDTCHLQSVTF